jgi:hypothetical protein
MREKPSLTPLGSILGRQQQNGLVVANLNMVAMQSAAQPLAT